MPLANEDTNKNIYFNVFFPYMETVGTAAE